MRDAMNTRSRDSCHSLPPLFDGQQLDRPTFHARYEATPEDTRAQLIGVVVVLGRGVTAAHGGISARLTGRLGMYSRHVEGVQPGGRTTILLDDLAEPEPDSHLYMEPEIGGRIRLDPSGTYLAALPELVIEVAHRPWEQATDLSPKLGDYHRNGAIEYVVVKIDPNEIHWFVRRHDRLEPIPPGPDDVLRSEVFPGLWLDKDALFSDDVDRLLETLEAGRAAHEHAAFVAQLTARKQP
jgi:Uma2 family endonuclease